MFMRGRRASRRRLEAWPARSDETSVDVREIGQKLVAACDRRIVGLLLAARRTNALEIGADASSRSHSPGCSAGHRRDRRGARSRQSLEVSRAVAEGRAIAWSNKNDLGGLARGAGRRNLCGSPRRDCVGAQTDARCGRRGRDNATREGAGMQQMSGGSMSGKVRIYEVAKQLNLDPKQVVGLFQAIGVSDVRNHMSSVEPEAIERVKRHLEKQRTHDVVEERVRFGRRQAPGRRQAGLAGTGDVASAPSMPPPSVRPSSSHASTRSRHARAERAAGPEPCPPARRAPFREVARPTAAESCRWSAPSSPQRGRAAPARVRAAGARDVVPVEITPVPVVPVVQPPPIAAPERPTDDTVAAAAPAPSPEPVVDAGPAVVAPVSSSLLRLRPSRRFPSARRPEPRGACAGAHGRAPRRRPASNTGRVGRACPCRRRAPPRLAPLPLSPTCRVASSTTRARGRSAGLERGATCVLPASSPADR
jgi:hypothetical protein